jgi:phosphoribosylformylglycinamidine (FGAM) synthase-like enzyme
VTESVRNVVASGASPVAISDCLCFGNPEKPEQMAEFVESVRGIIDACGAVTMVEYPTATLPVIAGNVSLYNEAGQDAIPPSPMISCLGVMPDVSKAITYDLKRSDTTLVMIGERKDECGGSVYYQLHKELGANLPKPDLATFGAEVHAVSYLIQQGLVLSAHDISEGGIATALAEMSFKNNIGMKVEVPGDLPLSKLLFGETGGFILEVKRDKINDIKTICAEHKLVSIVIGDTSKTPRLRINNVIDLPVADLSAAWENGLRDRLI